MVNVIIYCKSSENKICQNLIFKQGIVWWNAKDQHLLDFDAADINKYKYFAFHIDFKDNTMAYSASIDEIDLNSIPQKIYFVDYFSKLRVEKLKRILK